MVMPAFHKIINLDEQIRNWCARATLASETHLHGHRHASLIPIVNFDVVG
jgi:hypothetical protein